MEYIVIYSQVFKKWWQSLNINEKESVTAYIDLLEMTGVKLSYPYSSKIIDKTIKTKHMRELRIQHTGKPYRVLLHLIQNKKQFYS